MGSHRIAKNINISRQDLLLDKNKQWRLVESNSISAGMGPFCDKLVQAQKTLPINVNNHYVQNPATRLQAKSVFDAAVSLNGNTTPLIVFIVEERENNTFDQALLSDELEHLGARVKYKTLVELRLQLDSSGDSLILSEHGVVDLFYFRTGYNLDDYEFETSNSPNHSQVVTELPLIALRVWIESHRTLVCPSINYQLATSKWMQMKLSSLTVDDLESQLGSSHHIASIAYKTLGTKFFIPDSFDEIRSKLDSKRWLLKTQGEGGGNVFENYSEFEKSQDIKSESLDPYLLMAKIDVAHRQHPVAKLSNGECISHDNVISELGIFTMSSTNDYGGYLLRSKPESQLEAGIHNGDGFLDCLALVR